MNFYYGLVDETTNSWGFLEETDPRVTEDMVYLTRDEWMALLNGQSAGQQIVYYNGEVFLAEPGKYYVDEEGWHCKSDEEFDLEKATASSEALVTTLYDIKAAKAYGGITINEMLVFETNSTAITNTVASLALMADDATVNWKFYTIAGVPTVQIISKPELAVLAAAAQTMINASFAVEGAYTVLLQDATTEQLNSVEWVETFTAQAQASMDEITNQLTVEFAANA